MKNKNTCKQIQINLIRLHTQREREIYPIMCCAHIDLSIETHFWLGLDILKYSLTHTHTHLYNSYAKWQTNRSQILLVLVTGEKKVVKICVYRLLACGCLSAPHCNTCSPWLSPFDLLGLNE